MTQISIRDIRVFERLRKIRPQKVKELSESMKDLGQLQPVVLRPAGSKYRLVAGEHRLEAAKLLKWRTIDAAVFEGFSADDASLAEIDENLIRADLSPSEQALHVDERKTIYERRFPETKHGKTGHGREKSRQNGEPRNKRFSKDTADKTGQSERKVQRDAKRGKAGRKWLDRVAGTCLDKGDEIDALIKLPEKERNRLIEDAIAGKKVGARLALKKIKRDEREHQLAEKQRQEQEKAKKENKQRLYGVIYADPPWNFKPYSEETGMDRAPENHYPTMATDEIKKLSIPAAKDCVLFLWATAPMLMEALEVVESWGFSYKTHCIWAKNKIGLGYWFRNKHELLLVGVKGNIPAPKQGEQYESIIEALREKHSKKPFAFHEMIEDMFPRLPRIELFAREEFEGWDSWGNEVK